MYHEEKKLLLTLSASSNIHTTSAHKITPKTDVRAKFVCQWKGLKAAKNGGQIFAYLR